MNNLVFVSTIAACLILVGCSKESEGQPGQFAAQMEHSGVTPQRVSRVVFVGGELPFNKSTLIEVVDTNRIEKIWGFIQNAKPIQNTNVNSYYRLDFDIGNRNEPRWITLLVNEQDVAHLSLHDVSGFDDYDPEKLANIKQFCCPGLHSYIETAIITSSQTRR